MASNYEAIARENIEKYGTAIENYGPVLLERLYSDRTHFLYELLQNAEDALRKRNADRSEDDALRTVRFGLSHDYLEFVHRGIPFDEADVRGISGLVEGTKANDLTAIGKFGIGFKSVYAYSRTPEVHSGDEHFVIQSYVKPKAVVPRHTEADETLFHIPFNHPSAKPPQAFDEIQKRLEKLGLRTLLFLHQIKSIEWACMEGTSGRYFRQEKNLDRDAKEIILATDGANQEERWIVFSEPVPFPGTDSHGSIEVAIRVEQDSKTWLDQILPIDDSTLAAFFPTEIKTGFGFLIQGPYRTTPARDNIPKDEDWNRDLIVRTAKLVTKSLHGLKQLGLLSVNALQSLPIHANQFAPGTMFRPIFEEVRRALKNEDLIPKYSGGYVSGASAKITRAAGLRELLDQNQLRDLCAADVPLAWVDDQVSEDRTPVLKEYFVKQLEIEEITAPIFATRFTKRFVEDQSDEWMKKFYGFLLDVPAIWRPAEFGRPAGPLRSKELIRLPDNTHTAPFAADGRPNVYLPGPVKSDYPTVKPVLCDDEQSLDFLKQLGLAEPDVVDDVILHVLPRYKEARNVQEAPPEYPHDLQRIISAYKTDSIARKLDLTNQLREHYFIYCQTGDGSARCFRKAEEAYFLTPELSRYFGKSAAAWFIDESIVSLADGDAREMLTDCGLNAYPRVIPSPPELSYEEKARMWRRRSDGGCTYEIGVEDNTLDGLEDILQRIATAPYSEAAELARLIWKLLSEMVAGMKSYDAEQLFHGVYRWKRYDEWSEQFDAKFVRLLKESCWLPVTATAEDAVQQILQEESISTKLYRPTEIRFSLLSEGFEPNEFLQRKLGFIPETVAVLAEEMGLDMKLLDYIQRNRVTLEQLKKLIEPPTPDAATPEEHGNGRKTHTYVSAGRGSQSASPEAIARRQMLAPSGVAMVMEYERKFCRYPQEMPLTHKGYDIVSRNSEGNPVRYIEVKACPGTWEDSPVTLTLPEFTEALKRAQQYWLYVVEHALGDTPKIWRIQDAANRVDFLGYDAGWKALAEADGVEDENAAGKPDPPREPQEE